MGRALRLALLGVPVGGGGAAYQSRVLALAPIRYWPLDDAAGSVIARELVVGGNGTPPNVTFGVAGIGDGKTAASFNGTTSYINVVSAALATAFSGAEGTYAQWLKIPADVWGDGTTRRACRLLADASNFALVQKLNNSTLVFTMRRGGNTLTYTSAENPTNWIHIAMRWSTAANAASAFINGNKYAMTGTWSTWSGALIIAVIGASSITPDEPFSGEIAHFALWDKPLTDDEIASLANRP